MLRLSKTPESNMTQDDFLNFCQENISKHI